ncbi:MAG: hypothetical protein KDE25_12380 [Novosphingobium sp.]|nr:hypothetical protein [Novosphingobium sp.]
MLTKAIGFVKRALQSQRSQASTADVRIVGVPRSGTNYCKFLIESNSDLDSAFNLGWWKHAVIPPIMNMEGPVTNDTPTLVLYREPVEQMISFYKFAAQGRTAIMTTATDFSGFLRSPIVMQPHPGMEYWFPDPISYWLQFYYAALAWRGPKALLDLGALRSHPDLAFNWLKANVPRTFRFALERAHTDQYIGRNSDRQTGSNLVFEQNTSFEDEQAKNAKLISEVSDVDMRLIEDSGVSDLYKRLNDPESSS